MSYSARVQARLAQLVERVIDVDDVGGSNPSPRTKSTYGAVYECGSSSGGRA